MRTAASLPRRCLPKWKSSFGAGRSGTPPNEGSILAPGPCGPSIHHRKHRQTDNPTEARRYGTLPAERALSLSDFPNRGALLRGHATARRLVVGPYLIIYRADGDL